MNRICLSISSVVALAASFAACARILLSEKGAASFPRRRYVKDEYVCATQSFSVRGGEELFGLGDLLMSARG